jgi:hypothetical protein
MSTQPAENYIRKSVWNTRGWTFQERLLSPRNLIFTAGRMYFQCRCTARSADIITEDDAAGWSIEFKDSPLLMLQKLHTRPLSVYKQALELYMTRQLTQPKDILAAFTGRGTFMGAKRRRSSSAKCGWREIPILVMVRMEESNHGVQRTNVSWVRR